MSWQNYPVVRFAIPLIAGMALGYLSLDYGTVSLWWLVVPFILCTCVTVFLNFICNTHRHIILFGILNNVCIALFGAILMTHQCLSIEENVPEDGMPIRGVVNAGPQEKTRTFAVDIRTKNSRIIAYLDKNETHSPALLHEGDSIILQPVIVYPTFARQGEAENEDDTFLAFRRYLFCEGVSATCHVVSDAWERMPNPQRNGSWVNVFADVRNQMHVKYADAGLRDDAGSVVEAMTTGQRSSLDPKLRQAYARAGVSHVLALSGMHLAMLFVMFNRVVTHCMMRRWRRVAALMFIPAAWMFCLTAGMPPSLLRATIMFSVVQLALVIDAEQNLLNSCAIAAVIMLLCNPLWLMNVGFQLSFICIAGIGLANEEVKSGCRETFYGNRGVLQRILRPLLSAFWITFICTLSTFPLVAYYFGYVPLLGLLSSVVVSALVSVLLIMLLMWWIFTWCGFTTTLLTAAIIAIISLNNAIVDSVASIKMATVDYKPSAVAVILLYVFIISAWNFFMHRTSRSLQLSMISLTSLFLEQIIVS